MKLKYSALLTIIICTVLLIIQDVWSCSVPVFRYALERWRPDPYKGIYIYRNEISQKDQDLLRQLKEASYNAEAPLNLIIREVDVDSFPKEKLNELLQGPVPGTLPVLAIWYPNQMGKSHPVLKEKLTPSLVKNLVHSPKRREMAESLINGESVVWVFVPSGNTKKDDDAKELISQELDIALKNYSRMPYTILSGSEQKRLSYGFPLLTLSRDDPEERIFIETLMKSESDLYEYTSEPMVFPVFGRGRVLGCLFGKYITKKNIREASAFLAGSCSCEVKELNPGVDLLVAAPWDMVVMNSFVEDNPLPELTGVMPVTETRYEAEEPLSDEYDNSGGGAGLFIIYSVSIIGVVLIVAIFGFIISRRRSE